jgi:hypothetical protein
VLATLKDRDALEIDRYARFVRNMKWFVRVGLRTLQFCDRLGACLSGDGRHAHADHLVSRPSALEFRPRRSSISRTLRLECGRLVRGWRLCTLCRSSLPASANRLSHRGPCGGNDGGAQGKLSLYFRSPAHISQSKPGFSPNSGCAGATADPFKIQFWGLPGFGLGPTLSFAQEIAYQHGQIVIL